MAALQFLLLSLFNIAIIDSQICSNGLSSPPTISWTPSSLSPSTLTTTITFDVSTKTWNNGAISLTTRLFNHLLPAPTIRMERGKQYEILFINNLGPELPENADLSGAIERDPNTTNLHTHGVHIGGLYPGDDVLTTKITPGSNHTYIYNIPCSHSGGTHWYHSHHHPSVQLHVGGGAGGAIIIEDDQENEGLPDWYTQMRELIFFITHIDAEFINYGYPQRTQKQFDNQIILSLSGTNDQDLYLVNGEYQPTVCQMAGEWIKFRFAQTEIRDPQRYQIGRNQGDCTLKLLARDGVIVQNPPRSVGHIVWLAESSRADIAITCNIGTHSITALRPNSNMIIGYIQVDAINGNINPMILTPFNPIRPSYLTDLTHTTIDNTLDMEIRRNAIVVNGVFNHFNGANDPYFNGINSIEVDTINEWTLHTDNFGLFHPFHIHVNHFQLIKGPQNGQTPIPFQSHLTPLSGYQQEGDYLDTLWGPGIIRFTTDIWGGPVVVHCHRLEHEVNGAMGAVLVKNGCDNNYNDYNGTGSCTFNSDTCDPTALPTSIPTLEPTLNPTLQPTLNPTNPTIEPTYIPSKYPTVNPTYIPTNHPTTDPTLEPTINPTTNPSNDPTEHPSSAPSEIPTNFPTYQPSLYPTPYPTQQPSYYPTTDPTTHPTDFPTASPTNDPTDKPTESPSDAPTPFPSISPINDPSAFPSDQPTLFPSDQPTPFPSIPPTNNPAFLPTLEPTVYSTDNPTSFPSITPSVYPTYFPTVLLTSHPSDNPKLHPSIIHPVNPTVNPVLETTTQPTFGPTTLPPTNIPTIHINPDNLSETESILISTEIAIDSQYVLIDNTLTIWVSGGIAVSIILLVTIIYLICQWREYTKKKNMGPMTKVSNDTYIPSSESRPNDGSPTIDSTVIIIDQSNDLLYASGLELINET